MAKREIHKGHPMAEANEFQLRSLGEDALPGEYSGPYCITANGDYIIRFLMSKFKDFIPTIKIGDITPTLPVTTETYLETVPYDVEVDETYYVTEDRQVQQVYYNYTAASALPPSEGQYECQHYNEDFALGGAIGNTYVQQIDELVKSYMMYGQEATTRRYVAIQVAALLSQSEYSPEQFSDMTNRFWRIDHEGDLEVTVCGETSSSSRPRREATMYFRPVKKFRTVTRKVQVKKTRKVKQTRYKDVNRVRYIAVMSEDNKYTEEQVAMLNRIANAFSIEEELVVRQGAEEKIIKGAKLQGTDKPLIVPEVTHVPDTIIETGKQLDEFEAIYVPYRVENGIPRGLDIQDGKTITMHLFPNIGITLDMGEDQIIEKMAEYINKALDEETQDYVDREEALTANNTVYSSTAGYQLMQFPIYIHRGVKQFERLVTLRKAIL